MKVEEAKERVDLDKLIVTSSAIYLGLHSREISSNIHLYTINSLVTYNLKQNKIKKPKLSSFGIGQSIFPRSDINNDLRTMFETSQPTNDNRSRVTRSIARPGMDREDILQPIGRPSNTRRDRLQRDIRMNEQALRDVNTRYHLRMAQGDTGLAQMDLTQLGRIQEVIDRLRADLNREIRTNEQALRDRPIPTGTGVFGELNNANTVRMFAEGSTITNTNHVITERESLDTLNDVEIDPPRVEDWGFNMPDWTTEYKAKTIYKSVVSEKKELTLKQKRENIFHDFALNYGGVPALIKGYIINGILYTSNESISDKFPTTNNLRNIAIVLKYFILGEDGNISSKVVTKYSLAANTVGKSIDFYTPLLIKLKIKDITNSNTVFGGNKERKELLQSLEDSPYVEDWSIETANSKKLSSNTKVIMITNKEGKKVKFLFDDCEFINPDISGYNPPVNKTITNKSIVKILDKKLSKYNIFSENEEANVISIKINPSSKVISKQCKNHRKDIITISLLQSGRILQVYAQDLKFIKTIQQNEQPNIKKKSDQQTYYNFLVQQG
jgi:hypothetical protein